MIVTHKILRLSTSLRSSTGEVSRILLFWSELSSQIKLNQINEIVEAGMGLPYPHHNVTTNLNIIEVCITMTYCGLAAVKTKVIGSRPSLNVVKFILYELTII